MVAISSANSCIVSGCWKSEVEDTALPTLRAPTGTRGCFRSGPCGADDPDIDAWHSTRQSTAILERKATERGPRTHLATGLEANHRSGCQSLVCDDERRGR